MLFFHYFTTQNPAKHPITMFSIEHILFLIIFMSIITLGLSQLKKCNIKQIHYVEKILSSLLVTGELIYIIWAYYECPYPLYTEVLPLHLCSICFFLSAFAIFLDNIHLRKFIAINGLLGGVVAMIYPATIANAFPVISYRTIYFFISHSLIVFISIMQFKQINTLTIKDLRFNMIILSFFLALSIFTNYYLHTDYLFVGVPPTIGIIRIIYNFVGLWFYLPTAIILFSIVEALLIFIFNKVQKIIITHTY